MTKATASAELQTTEAVYQDPIVLLQEEVARLEEEVRLRDEALAQQASPALEPVAPAPDAQSDAQLHQLKTQLESRDETIALLLEEVHRYEDAETASQAEWEQLSQWVAEVEQRIETRDQLDAQLPADLAVQRETNEALRRSSDAERRAWETQRAALEDELGRLRAELARVARKTDPRTIPVLEVLEDENSRLRDACHQLSRSAAAAAEVEAVRSELDSARTHFDEARTKIRLLEDEMQRERMEHEAALAAARSVAAREALVAGADEAPAAPEEPRAIASPTAIDERIRAFRQHLHELHEHEQEARARNRLTARLSRLWNRTAPGI